MSIKIINEKYTDLFAKYLGIITAVITILGFILKIFSWSGQKGIFLWIKDHYIVFLIISISSFVVLPEFNY